MWAALRDAPLVRLHGGWWVSTRHGIDPMATKGDRPRGSNTDPIQDVDTHGTNTVKALKRRGLVALLHPHEQEPRTWTTGTIARLTTGGKDTLDRDP